MIQLHSIVHFRSISWKVVFEGCDCAFCLLNLRVSTTLTGTYFSPLLIFEHARSDLLTRKLDRKTVYKIGFNYLRKRDSNMMSFFSANLKMVIICSKQRRKMLAVLVLVAILLVPIQSEGVITPKDVSKSVLS